MEVGTMVTARKLKIDRHQYPPRRVTDIHSKLNVATVRHRIEVETVGDVSDGLALAAQSKLPVAVCGGRHAMGGQQFASDGVQFDMSGMNRVLNFDPASGLIEVEAGIQWPKLMKEYLSMQAGNKKQWGIRQKQTGADRLSMGGALAANIHGRVLANKPLIEDIVSFRLIDANGHLINCSRNENTDLFCLVIGGYGLFGVVISVTLQLVPRQKVQRIVEIHKLEDLEQAFASRIADGYLYGDFQFVTDEHSGNFLKRGVFSCYRPVANDTPIPDGQIYMTPHSWQDLLHLAHIDKANAFDAFARFYMRTTGQIYWSDTHQFSLYLDDYHSELDKRLCGEHRGSEMITELYVPINNLADFMQDAGEALRSTKADLIYGTIRLIREDDESFLSWAKKDFACVIFNLHVTHTDDGVAAARRSFLKLIDTALAHDGSFFLTYHRYADKEQVEQAYPQFAEFLDRKMARDPHGLFASDWYRHYEKVFGKGRADQR